MDLSWAEAGNRGVWSFVSLIALPHPTAWRFGTRNIERWIASDLTRHTWARLWWQAVVFENELDLPNALTESDLNQLLERRSIGGDARLVRALGWAIVNESTGDVPRRYLIRDVTLRLRLVASLRRCPWPPRRSDSRHVPSAHGRINRQIPRTTTERPADEPVGSRPDLLVRS